MMAFAWWTPQVADYTCSVTRPDVLSLVNVRVHALSVMHMPKCSRDNAATHPLPALGALGVFGCMAGMASSGVPWRTGRDPTTAKMMFRVSVNKRVKSRAAHIARAQRI